MDLRQSRREYGRNRLDERDVAPDPLDQLRRWLAEAADAGLHEPNAMALATASPGGVPSVRTVLLKGIDAGGLVFVTNYRSRKGRELEANPVACLLFYWGPLERQVCIEGPVSRTDPEQSRALFAARPLPARLAAWASPQSEVIADRHTLDDRMIEMERRFADDPPRPEFWGGLRLRPRRLEFWQGRAHRLHDRLCYEPAPGGGWSIRRLAP